MVRVLEPHETIFPTPFACPAKASLVIAPIAPDGFETVVLRLPNNAARDMPHFWFKDL